MISTHEAGFRLGLHLHWNVFPTRSDSSGAVIGDSVPFSAQTSRSQDLFPRRCHLRSRLANVNSRGCAARNSPPDPAADTESEPRAPSRSSPDITCSKQEGLGHNYSKHARSFSWHQSNPTQEPRPKSLRSILAERSQSDADIACEPRLPLSPARSTAFVLINHFFAQTTTTRML